MTLVVSGSKQAFAKSGKGMDIGRPHWSEETRMSERIAQRGGVAQASRACSASLTQVWAISSKRALLVGSLMLCARRRHWAALFLVFPGFAHTPSQPCG